MPNKIKTFVFDLGGVVFADGSSKIGSILEKEKGYDPELIQKIIKSEKRREALRGKIQDEEFWNWAKAQLPPDYDIDYIRNAYYGSYKLDEDISKLILELKKLGYRRIIFSGNMKSRVEYLEQKYNFSKNFDGAVYSFVVGHTKPDPEFFEAMINVIKCDPSEAIFIDDREDNLKLVEKYGVKTTFYSEGKIKKLLSELKKLGVEISPN
ncbi:MAG: HAD-IA family hydrolase [Patescibacteria group bacterium]